MASAQPLGIATLASLGQVMVKTRESFGISHLLSASYLCRKVGELEKEHATEQCGPFFLEIQALAVSAVFSAFAGLEAYANEIFIDHIEYYPEQRPEVMEKLWETYERKDVLEKVEFALLLKGIPTDRGANLWVQINALKSLRDALTHFKAEWSDEKGNHRKLSSQLQNKAVKSPFQPNADLFPNGWISHGTVKWAVQSATAFLLDLEEKLPPIYPKIRFRIDQLSNL